MKRKTPKTRYERALEKTCAARYEMIHALETSLKAAKVDTKTLHKISDEKNWHIAECDKLMIEKKNYEARLNELRTVVRQLGEDIKTLPNRPQWLDRYVDDLKLWVVM